MGTLELLLGNARCMLAGHACFVQHGNFGPAEDSEVLTMQWGLCVVMALLGNTYVSMQNAWSLFDYCTETNLSICHLPFTLSHLLQ